MDMKKDFIVHHEKGRMHVIAATKEDAIEEYYHALESILGHTLQICRCFGEPKPIDRNLVCRVIKVDELVKGVTQT